MDHFPEDEHIDAPLLHAKKSHPEDSHHDHGHSHHQAGGHGAGHGYDENELMEQKGLRLFPVFGDHRLSMFSMNYGLYLEFFHIIVRMLGRLFLLVIFFNLIDITTKQYIFNKVSFSGPQVVAECRDFTGEAADDCAREYYIVSKCYRHSVRICYTILTCLCAAIFLTVIRRKDEQRVINNRMLYEFNWTQDLFSALVDKVPKKTSPDELRAYFNNLPAIKKIGGSVKDILMVQDYGKCYITSKQIQRTKEQIEKLQAKGQPTHELDGKLQFLHEELIRQEASMPPHSGRAIVVFDSLKTKALVMKLYRPTFGASIEKKFRKKKGESELEDANLSVKDLPEPQDLKFENMCYPKEQKVKRLIAVYALGLLIIAVGSLLGFGIEVIPEAQELEEKAKHEVQHLFHYPVKDGVVQIPKSHSQEHHGHSLFQTILHQIGIPVLLLVLEGVSEGLFKRVNKYTRHKSHSEIEISCLDYAIFSSFFLYLFIQGSIMALSWEEGSALVQTTIKVFCIKYVGKKLASAYFAHKSKHAGDDHRSSRSPSRSASMMSADAHSDSPHSPSHGHGHSPMIGAPKHHKKKELHLSMLATIVKVLFHVDIENEEFDFFEEASRAFPLIAMNFAFMANGYTSITFKTLFPPGIPLTMLAIFIGALCDKYRLMNQHEHCHLNSARFMLKMFRFLRGDHFAAIFGAAVWTISFFWYILGYQQQVGELKNIDQETKDRLAFIFDSLNYTVGTACAVIVAFYLFYIVAWPTQESLETQFGKRFIDNKSSVSYDSVSEHFTAVYQKPALYHAEEFKNRQSLVL